MSAITLIINTCNQPDYLERVLRAAARQSSLPEEVIIADDGSDEATRGVFDRWAGAQTVRTGYVWQEKAGFRRTRILNQAIARATSPYIVFLDGDTIPHPRFLDDHRRLARPRFFVQGHRALVREQASATFGAGNFAANRCRALLTGQLRGLKHVFRWLIPLTRVLADEAGVRGCNLGVWRSDLIRVNGFDEHFVGWGCEDHDLAVRLIHSGVRRLDVRGRALCYHLWHPPAERSSLPLNRQKLNETKTVQRIKCQCGLDQHCAV